MASANATIDESALTGEPLPVTCAAGDPVRSGAANAGEAFDLQATRRAADSAYAAIVRLVLDAEHQRTPFVRMADRYAAFLLPVTVLLAGGAWAFSGDAVRALAVLVVATPCPLILAAPIALVSGVSRAARVGIVVKGAGVIEQLGRVRTRPRRWPRCAAPEPCAWPWSPGRPCDRRGGGARRGARRGLSRLPPRGQAGSAARRAV